MEDTKDSNACESDDLYMSMIQLFEDVDNVSKVYEDMLDNGGDVRVVKDQDLGLKLLESGSSLEDEYDIGTTPDVSVREPGRCNTNNPVVRTTIGSSQLTNKNQETNEDHEIEIDLKDTPEVSPNSISSMKTIDSVGFENQSSLKSEYQAGNESERCVKDLSCTTESSVYDPSDVTVVVSDKFCESDLETNLDNGKQNDSVKESKEKMNEFLNNPEDCLDTSSECSNEVSYSSFIITTSEDECNDDVTVIANKAEQSEVKGNTANGKECSFKYEKIPFKRKRNLSTMSDNENTPMKRRHPLFDPKYSNTDICSPILNAMSVDRRREFADNSEETPVILSKFMFPDTDNTIANSTPVTTNDSRKIKDKLMTAKKSIWTFNDESTEKALGDFSGFSSSDTLDSKSTKTYDEIVHEITQLCEDGLKKDKGTNIGADQEINCKENISKIDLESIITSSDCEETQLKQPNEDFRNVHLKPDASVCGQSIASETGLTKATKEMFDKEDQKSTTATSNTTVGRFKNCDTTVSIIHIDDSEDELDLTEDILGLDSYDDYDIDELDEKTLLADSNEKLEVETSNVDKTAEEKSLSLSVCLSLKEKIQTQLKELNEDSSVDSSETVSDFLNKTEIKTEPNSDFLNKTEIKTEPNSTTRTCYLNKTETNTESNKSQSSCYLNKTETNTESNKSQSSCYLNKTETNTESNKSQSSMELFSTNYNEIQKPTVSSKSKMPLKPEDLDNSIKFVKPTKILQPKVMNNSENIASKESGSSKNEKENLKINKTTTTKIEKENVSNEVKENQLPLVNDMITNTKLVDKNQLMVNVRKRWKTDGIPCPDTNLTMALTFRRKNKEKGLKAVTGLLEGEKLCCINMYQEKDNHSMDYSTIKETLSRLKQQKDTMETMHFNRLFQKRDELAVKLDTMKARHLKEMKILQLRQNVEMRKVRSNRRINPMLLQTRFMQLQHEHSCQITRMKDHQIQEHDMLLDHLNDIMNTEQDRLGQQSMPIQELISQLENPQNITTSGSPQKYGPPIMVTLRQGPSRINGNKHSRVTVGLPAIIAQAVSHEDDIFDHFYSYVY